MKSSISTLAGPGSSSPACASQAVRGPRAQRGLRPSLDALEIRALLNHGPLQSLELKAHQAAAEVNKLSAQIGALDLQIANETTALAADPTDKYLKTTLRGQSKTVRSLSERQQKEESSLAAFNAKIVRLGGTPVPVLGSTTGSSGGGSGNGGGGGGSGGGSTGGGQTAQVQDLAYYTSQLADQNGITVSEEDLLPIMANLWKALQNEGEVLLGQAQYTTLSADPNAGTFTLNAFTTDGVEKYPFTVSFGTHAKNASFAVQSPSPLLTPVSGTYIATTLSDEVPGNLQPIAESTFLPLAKQWAADLATVVPEIPGVTLVSDTAYSTTSGTYQILDVYVWKHVFDGGINYDYYFPAVFVVNQNGDTSHSLFQVLPFSTTPPTQSSYPPVTT
jgi:hypothetical protein